MFELPTLLPRRRRLLVRLMLMGGLGLIATLAVLPRADARQSAGVGASLLSPEPVASYRFATLYALPQGTLAAPLAL